MKRVILICAIFFGICHPGVYAQDIHFSQFYMSPLNLNPALTGVMRSSQRFVANYRNQWSSSLGANAYNTYSASYDQKIPVGTYDYFGIGGSFWGDVAGESRFGSTSGRVSASFSYYLNGDWNSAHYLSVGTDVGIVQRRIRISDLRWPSQHNGNGAFDSGLPGEVIDDNNVMYPDLSLGLMWFSVFDAKTSFFAGFAVSHINQANVSFLKQSVSLHQRYTLNVGGEYPISENVSLIPGLILMAQGPHREYNGGANLKFALGLNEGQSDSFQLGVWGRLGNKDTGGLHSDAIILTTRFETGNYGIGFSYDYTISEFREAGIANGSFEFSLSYLINKVDYRKYWYPKI